jgi:hypothetical protein
MLEFYLPEDPYANFVNGMMFRQQQIGVLFETLDLKAMYDVASTENADELEIFLGEAERRLSKARSASESKSLATQWWEAFAHLVVPVPTDEEQKYAWYTITASAWKYGIRWVVFANTFHPQGSKGSRGPIKEMFYPLDTEGRLLFNEGGKHAGSYLIGMLIKTSDSKTVNDDEGDSNDLLCSRILYLYPALMATSLINQGEANVFDLKSSPSTSREYERKNRIPMKTLKRVEPLGAIANRIGNNSPDSLQYNMNTGQMSDIPRDERRELERFAEKAGKNPAPLRTPPAVGDKFAALHPFRLQRLRPFVKNLADELDQSRRQDFESRRLAFSAATNRYNLLYQYMLNVTTDNDDNTPEHLASYRSMGNEVYTLFFYAAYKHRGGNIFYLNRELSEEFIHTDVGEVPIEEIKLPYSALYIAFELADQWDKRFELGTSGDFVDGAYVNKMEAGPLQVMLTTRRRDVDYSSRSGAFARADRQYLFSFFSAHLGLSLQEAIQAALEKPNTYSPEGTDEVHEKVWVENDLSLSFGVDSPEAGPQAALASKYRGLPVFEEALKLIINGLAYITSYPEEIDREYPKGAPERLVKRAQDGQTKQERERNRSKLHALGFSEIHYCGKSLAKERAAEEESGAAGLREVSTHWRRGHWRLQPFGVMKTENRPRRLRWIRPILVRRDRGDVAEHTHLYALSKQS